MDTCECTECGEFGATEGMDYMCADCYWDADAERKKALRNDPVWRFNRMCSFAVTCMDMDREKAVTYALKEMNLTEPPSASE